VQNQDFRIQYESVQRVFVLPRNHSPLTLVVLAVDPPVRKGQTHYSHVLAQFPTDEDVTVSLQLTPEQLAQKNENTVRLAAVFPATSRIGTPPVAFHASWHEAGVPVRSSADGCTVCPE
jgi:hypothetical protein